MFIICLKFARTRYVKPLPAGAFKAVEREAVNNPARLLSIPIRLPFLEPFPGKPFHGGSGSEITPVSERKHHRLRRSLLPWPFSGFHTHTRAPGFVSYPPKWG